MDATRVTPAAIQPRRPSSRRPGSTSNMPGSVPVRRPTAPPPSSAAQRGRVQPAPAPKAKAPKANVLSRLPDWRTSMGCLLRMFILSLFGMACLLLTGGTVVLYEYYSVAATLPSVDDLKQRASQFETTRILDRNGNVLYEIIDPNAGRRTYVPLSKVSPYLLATTIATEDRTITAIRASTRWRSCALSGRTTGTRARPSRGLPPSRSNWRVCCFSALRSAWSNRTCARCAKPWRRQRSPAATPRMRSWSCT